MVQVAERVWPSIKLTWPKMLPGPRHPGEVQPAPRADVARDLLLPNDRLQPISVTHRQATVAATRFARRVGLIQHHDAQAARTDGFNQVKSGRCASQSGADSGCSS
jgi:hypothetical protein